MKEIDLYALLNRSRLRIPEADAFAGQRIVVTGAGGSIGSAIVRRLAGKVEALWCLGHSESPIFKLKQEFDQFPNVQFAICDVGHHPGTFLRRIQPDTVIHAAAHKHVGLMESAPDQAFRNNTEATIRLAYAAYAAGVQRFVFISTDKAAKPTSVMGASKRLAEAWLLTRAPFASVCRFGNVAGSSGSLIEIVYERLKAGQNLELTNPGMYRWFITPEEAVDLALAASCRPGLYTLDMGKPVKIQDIMERMMVQLDMQQIIIYTRPGSGEKLDEDLLNPDETAVSFNAASDLIFVKNRLNLSRVDEALEAVRCGSMTLVEAANSL